MDGEVEGMRKVLLFLVLVSFALSSSLEEVARFFEREGFVVEKEGEEVLLDLGKGKAFPGERFVVLKKVKELRHPVTGEVIGYKEEKTGLVEVKEVEDAYSEAKVLEDEGIERGQRVRLLAEEVCYEGSEEGLYQLKKYLPQLKKGKDCLYLVREMEKGYGVSFKGEPIAFFPKPASQVLPKDFTFEDFAYKAKFIRAFGDIPYSADMCKLFGDREYLLVLFPDKLKVYRFTGREFVEVLTYSPPAGQGVGVVCYGEEEPLVIVNMLVNGEASSAVLRPSGEDLLLVAKDVPYLFGKLEGRLVGQGFKNGSWGEPYAFVKEGNVLRRAQKLDLPPEFRIDGAAKKGELLVFVDSLGRLRVYEKGEEVLTEDGFGLSYTQAELPEVHGYDEGKYFFYAKPAFATLFEKVHLPLIPKNRMGGVFKILGMAKFSEGELWTTVKRKKYYELKKLKGRPFKEAIQAVLVNEEGRVFVITASKGTLPLQSRGEIYELEVSPF